jgi:hypothetical protein
MYTNSHCFDPKYNQKNFLYTKLLDPNKLIDFSGQYVFAMNELELLQDIQREYFKDDNTNKDSKIELELKYIKGEIDMTIFLYFLSKKFDNYYTNYIIKNMGNSEINIFIKIYKDIKDILDNNIFDIKDKATSMILNNIRIDIPMLRDKVIEGFNINKIVKDLILEKIDNETIINILDLEEDSIYKELGEYEYPINNNQITNLLLLMIIPDIIFDKITAKSLDELIKGRKLFKPIREKYQQDIENLLKNIILKGL